MSSSLNVDAAAFTPSYQHQPQPSKVVNGDDSAALKKGKQNRKNQQRKKKKTTVTSEEQPSGNSSREARVPKGHRATNERRRREASTKNGRKGHRQKELQQNDDQISHADESKQIGDSSSQSEQVFEFPPLGPAGSTSTNKISSSSSGWARIALEGQAAEDVRLEREARERSLAERNMGLTFLTNRPDASPIGVVPKIISSHESTVVCETLNQENHQQQKSKLLMSSTKRVGDMTKMRDRWWQVLKEKRTRDIEEALRQQREEQCEDTASEEPSVVHDNDSESDESSVEEEQGQVNLVHYNESPHPLHKAIIDDDEHAVRQLLHRHSDKRENIFISVSRRQLGLAVSTKLLSDDLFSPLHLAVYLDRPHVLRTLLSDSILVKLAESSSRSTALMLAAELSVDGCIQQLLSRVGATGLTTKDAARGETAIHYACRAGVPSSTLKILLTWLNGGGQNMQKPLSCRNLKGQTPLHVAAEGAHTHLVETILQLCSPPLLSKLLRIQDEKKQTPLLAALTVEASEAVMALLMSSSQWVHYPKSGKYNAPSACVLESKKGPCPLSWAVSLGSMEMMHILLEFSGTDVYNLDAALQAAVRSSSPNSLEIVRVLVDAGANPALSDSGMQAASPTSAFSIAASRGDATILGILIDAYQYQSQERRLARRQDPKLQKQPETYFRTIEETETLKFRTSLNDALVLSLWLGWRNSRFDCLQASLTLFKKGTLLKDTGFARIKRSIIDNDLKDSDEVSERDEKYTYESDYTHYGDPDSDELLELGAYDITVLKFWTTILMQFPWMRQENDITCSWILSERGSSNRSALSSSSQLETVTFVAKGVNFTAHPWIIGRKCAKLAAAIRFAELKQADNIEQIEIHLDLTSKQCKWLLQHIYSGSLLSGWGPDTCEELMELSLVAHEFLCPTLVQECEMRLLSSNLSQCFCWSCCLAVRKTRDGSAQCLYRVSGPSSSLLAKTAIDALALSEQMGSFDMEEYRIKFWASPKYPSSSDVSFKHAWNHYDSNAHFLTTPFAAVKEAAVQAILLEFSNVLRSESFLNQLHDRLGEADSTEPIVSQELEAQAMLLQLCLDDIAETAMSRLEKTLMSVLSGGLPFSRTRLAEMSVGDSNA
jgi:ankyrin repeat protein